MPCYWTPIGVCAPTTNHYHLLVTLHRLSMRNLSRLSCSMIGQVVSVIWGDHILWFNMLYNWDYSPMRVREATRARTCTWNTLCPSLFWGLSWATEWEDTCLVPSYLKCWVEWVFKPLLSQMRSNWAMSRDRMSWGYDLHFTSLPLTPPNQRRMQMNQRYGRTHPSIENCPPAHPLPSASLLSAQ